MYRTRTCPFCVMAADMLTRLGFAFREEYLDDHPDRRAATEAILQGHQTVPLVVVGDRPIGGFDKLRQLAEDGRLEAVLNGEAP